jgi:hypothetical protein
MSWQLPCHRARPRKTPSVHYCIMRRLSYFNARMPDPHLIKLLQRLPSTTVRQRVSPANTHYEMLASLDGFNAERFCRQQDLAQLPRCSWLSDSMSILCSALTSTGPPSGPQCSSFTVSLFHPVAARLRSPSITIWVLPDFECSYAAWARTRSTSTRATTRSRTSRPTCPSARRATSCARTSRVPANSAAA